LLLGLSRLRGNHLTLYSKRIIKVTGKFKKIMAVALISYLVFAVISLFAAFMGVATVDGVNFGSSACWRWWLLVASSDRRSWLCAP